MLAEVVLSGVPTGNPYTYEVPPLLQDVLEVGQAVSVSFGRRLLLGVVVRIFEPEPNFQPVYQIKPIADLLDEVPVLNAELLRLTQWMSTYYLCDWGEVIRAALPNGLAQVSRHVYHPVLAENLTYGLTPLQAEVLHAIEHHPGQTREALSEKLGKTISLPTLKKLEAHGVVRCEVEIEGGRVRAKTIRHVRFKADAQTHLAQLRTQLRGTKQQAILAALHRLIEAEQPEPAQNTLLKSADADAASLKSLVKAGVVEVIEKEVIRTPYGDEPDQSGRTDWQHPPHEDQRSALAALQQAIQSQQYHTFLLHGVTGSGKTEVYIAALKQVLERGQSGLILVPEIALTPQTVKRFRAHFGDQIAVLHSRMSNGERYDAWRMLRDGRYRVAIGPRSAIFAPLRNLGLIVVDEEHETSYKQYDPAPRYHARDVAIYRAQMNGAVCVLGSATPSMESYVNAGRGKYTLLRMPVRVPVKGKRAQLPTVETIDLGIEQQKKTLKGALSDALRNAIEQRLSRNEQVILLQNRRGYAPVISCESCGWSPECTQCAVTLTFHKTHHHLRCHYCGQVHRMPHHCPQCSGNLKQTGIGTQRVEEELVQLFPQARIVRMDQDTTSRKDAHRNMLMAFGEGEYDILLGTQMVAKGLDFPNVTLVGVVNADTGLLLPDFRSSEQTFQLLAQVAGRAGRGELRGEVLIQTRNPRHPSLLCAETHDYETFINGELPLRRALHYPPFGRLIAIEFRSEDEDTARKMADQWAERLRQAAPEHVEILGPTPPMIIRIKHEFRFHLLLRAQRKTSPHVLQQLVLQTRTEAGTPPHHGRINIDVDPVGLF